MFTQILGGGEWSNFKLDEHILPTGLKPPSSYQLASFVAGSPEPSALNNIQFIL